MTYPLGTTSRFWGSEHEPLRHALELPLRRTSKTGRLYFAICGAGVSRQPETFDPEHSRACRRCRKTLTERGETR